MSIKYIIIWQESFSGPLAYPQIEKFYQYDMESWILRNSSWVSVIEKYEVKQL